MSSVNSDPVTYWRNYYTERMRYVTDRIRGTETVAKYAAQIGADTIWYSSIYGCNHGCPDGDKGHHKFSCPKAINNARVKYATNSDDA